jgi:hypothetical protein
MTDYSLAARATLLRQRLDRERAARVRATGQDVRVAVPTADALWVTENETRVDNGEMEWDADGYGRMRPVRATVPWGEENASRTGADVNHDHVREGDCGRLHRPHRPRAQRTVETSEALIAATLDLERADLRGRKGKSRMIRKARVARLERIAAMLEGERECAAMPTLPTLPAPRPFVPRRPTQAEYYGWVPDKDAARVAAAHMLAGFGVPHPGR